MIYFYQIYFVTPQQRLIQAAQELRSRVYASLPWGYRVGRFLYELRFAAEPGVFGRFAYGLFLMCEVQGLPRTDVYPKTVREIDKLPRDYGCEFGFKARSIAYKYLGAGGDPEEVLSATALKMLTSPTFRKAIHGEILHRAESYVLVMVKNVALEQTRKQRNRHLDIEELIEEPSSWDDLGKILPEKEKDELARELEQAVSPRLMPDLGLYFQLLLEGRSNQEIAEHKLLPSLKEHPMTQQGLAKYRTKIKDVLREHFDVRSSASPEGREWASTA